MHVIVPIRTFRFNPLCARFTRRFARRSRYIVKSGGVAACFDPTTPIMTLSYQHSPSVIISVPLSHMLHPSVEVIDGSGMVNHTMEVVEGEGCMEVLLLGGGVGAFAFKGISSPSYLVTIRTEGGGNVVDDTPSSTPSFSRQGKDPHGV